MTWSSFSGLLPLALALLLSCGGEGEDLDSAEEMDPGAAAGEREEEIVRVELDEYGIVLPDSLVRGRHLFRIRNGGFEEHNLVFRPKGEDEVVWETEPRLNPGEVRDVEVELDAGVYSVVCTVSNHESRGMFTDLVVADGPPEG